MMKTKSEDKRNNAAMEQRPTSLLSRLQSEGLFKKKPPTKTDKHRSDEQKSLSLMQDSKSKT